MINWRLLSCNIFFLLCLTIPAAPILANTINAAQPVLSPPAAIAKIQQRGYLRVAIFGGFDPPFIENNNGHLTGYDIDLVNMIARNLHVKIKYISVSDSYDALIPLINHHEADLGISSLSRTLERAQYVQFSIPYLLPHYAMLVNRLGPFDSQNENDLKQTITAQKTNIGVLTENTYAKTIPLLFPAATVKPYRALPAMLSALNNKQIDAIFDDEFFLESTLKNDPTLALHLKIKTLNEHDSYGIMINYDDVALMAWINLFLELSKENGILNTLDKTYLT